MLEWIILLPAAFIAGALNAVAGGGSFLTLPALVFVGVPPVAANATGTVALLPGYMASAWGFREDIQAPPRLSLKNVVLLSLLGGSSGAALLLLTSDQAFRVLVPWLLLLATGAFAFAPQLRQWTLRGSEQPPATATAVLGLLTVAAYGGYFNGGLGILLLALLGLLGQTNLNTMNGMKNLISALLTAIAVAIYAAGGVVEWSQALGMMVAASAGGYSGARVARHIPAVWLRAGIVLTGLVMAALFFWKQP